MAKRIITISSLPEGGLMKKEFHQENRASLCQSLAPGSLLLLFSGHAPRKTGDEDYPYFADRSFVYYTGIEQQDSILAILVDKESVQEMLFMLPPDAHAERWNGKRLSPQEAQDVSGISDFRYLTDFSAFLDKQLVSGAVSTVCLDLTEKKKVNSLCVRHSYWRISCAKIIPM